VIVRNPATNDALGEVAVSSTEELDAAIGRARIAQRGWAATPRHERHRILVRFSELLAAHAPELSRLLALESGKPLGQAEAEIEVSARLYRGYAERMLAMSDSAHALDNQPGNEGDLLVTRQEPLGVVAAILPFNFPSDVLAHKAGPAIATGNAVVAKPSEEDPLTVTRELELLLEAGLPEAVLQLVYGGPDVGRSLVADDRIAAVSFTGSTEAGISVASTVAKRLAPAFLELGGNDALIVLDDADLELVVDEAVNGRLAVNGQCCISNKRLIVAARVHDELLERVAVRFAALRVGDPLEPATDVGPLISAEAAERVDAQVAATLSAGARLVGGGNRDGNFFAPTVLSNVTPAMEIARDLEVFGPVLPVIAVRSEDEAVAVANASRYGLSGAVFSRDLARAMSVATRLETGQVVLNGSGQYRADVSPFGGYKYSGVGREGLSTSLREFVQNKNIVFRGLLTPAAAAASR
jgi:succinate-semialdehyde dehydrogenase / glutarate-semialdehyde dehydrogenase